MFPKRVVGFLVALHIIFAAVYACIAPYRTPGLIQGTFMPDIAAPDELAHSQYVQYLAEGKGLPSPIASKDMATYEAHQPPLYYALSAVWAKLGGRTDFDAPSTGIWLRLLNVLIGGLTVLGACWVSWLASRRTEIAIVASAVVALLPMNVGLSASINNDPLLICLGTYYLAMLVKAYRDGWDTKTAVIAGVLLGCSLLTKTSALAFFLPLAASWIVAGKQKKQICLFAAAATALAIAAPLWIRNGILYHDPLLLRTFAVNSAGDAMPDIHSLRALAHYSTVFVQHTTMSFFGMLGYMAIAFPPAVYSVLILATGFLVIGCVRHRFSQESKDNRGLNWIIGAMLIGSVILYIRFNLSHTEAQARYFFTALAPIGYFLAVGFCHWFPRRFHVAFITLVVALAALNATMAATMAASFRTMQDDLREAGGPQMFHLPKE